VGAPQKALSTELVAGMNMNGGKQMHIFTSYRSDSSMQLCCTKVKVSVALASFQLFAQIQEPKSRRHERSKK
jgi:hypothetical protein